MTFRSLSKGYAKTYMDAHANRVEGASPHELVSIMFEELLLQLDTAIKHAERDENAPMLEAKSKASAIVNALNESLDFERGGDTAVALGVVYREAADRLSKAKGPAAKDILQSIRQMIAEIFSAWQDIGKASKSDDKA